MSSPPTSSSSDLPDHLPVYRWRSYIILFRRNPGFRLFWLAGVISQAGNWFNYIGIFFLLTRLSGSETAVSWFLIAKFLPTSLLGPAAGIIADRLSRKTVMVCCDLARVFIVLGFLLVRRPEEIWLVYVLAFIQESLWTFYDPARRAAVTNLCTANELNLANALSGATWSVMLAFGAGLGGLVTAFLGWQTAIVIDALTFAVSALMLSRLALVQTSPEQRQQLAWHDYIGWGDLVDGCRYVAARPKVKALLLVKSGWALSGGFLVLLTIFGEQVFKVPGEGGGSGLLYSVRGIGAAIGPVLAWRFLGETRRAMYLAIGASFFISSIAYLIFSRAPGIISALPLVLVAHMGGSVQWVFSTSLLQGCVEDMFRGRVFAAEMVLFTLLLSLSTYLTGLALASGVDPRQAMLWLALLFLLPGTLWSCYTWRKKPYQLR